MAAVFGGVLLFSFALQMLFSPAGGAVLRALDTSQVAVRGIIAVSPSEPGQLVLYSSNSAYALADQREARAYLGRQVRITGILHKSTGLLEIRSIALAALTSISTAALDPAAKTP
jgi:hypothetical protein